MTPTSDLARDQERDVRAYFALLKTEPASEHKGLLERLAGQIMDPHYRDGDIAAVASGGLVDDIASGCPTGILPIRSLRELHYKYTEIDWQRLIELGDGVIDPRLIHVASVIQGQFSRRSWEAATTDGSGIELLHLNTYRQVPLFAEFARRSVEARPLPSYGLPAIYTSRVDTYGEERTLSPCSIDIVEDRAVRGAQYDRGLLYTVGADEVFHIDRKANLRYQNWFLGRALKECGLMLGRAAVADHAATLTALSGTLEAVAGDPAARFHLAAEAAGALGFSIVGYCLFELTHELATDLLPSLRSANEFLVDLDPSQREWSMRRFSLPDRSAIEAITSAHAQPGLTFTALSHYVGQNILTRLRAFLGPAAANAEACAFNSLFGARIDKVQHDHQPDHFGRLTMQVPDDFRLPAIAQNYCELDRRTLRLAFRMIPLPTDVQDALRGSASPTPVAQNMTSVLADLPWQRAALRAYARVSANTLKILAANGAGSVGVPFQPDTRGEVLITPLLRPTAIDSARRVRIHLRQGRYHVDLDDATTVRAPVVIRDPSPADPALRQAFGGLYGHVATTPRATYEHVFHDLRRVVDSMVPAAIDAFPRGRDVIAVVVPFFKEHASYMRIAEEALLTFAGRPEFLAIVLVSNQQPEDFVGNVSRLEKRLSPRHRQADGNFVLLSLNTPQVGALEHWMVEKFANVHAATYLLAQIAAAGICLRDVAFLEGDLQSVAEWLDTWLASSPKPKITLFQYSVGITDESGVSTESPTFDNCDAILAKQFASPLTQVVFGPAIEQLLGGSFVLSGDLLSRYLAHLDESEHVESLVESWLPSLLVTDASQVLSVAPKVHLPAVDQRIYGTDSKTVKWVADLFYALERAIASSPARDFPLGAVRSLEPPPEYRFEAMGADAFERRHEALTRFGYFRGACVEVLGEALTQSHASVIAALGKDKSAVAAVADNAWVETIVRFFVYTRGKRLEEGEEYFALKLLFDARLVGLGNSGAMIGNPVVDPGCLASCRKLLRAAHVS